MVKNDVAVLIIFALLFASWLARQILMGIETLSTPTDNQDFFVVGARCALLPQKAPQQPLSQYYYD